MKPFLTLISDAIDGGARWLSDVFADGLASMTGPTGMFDPGRLHLTDLPDPGSFRHSWQDMSCMASIDNVSQVQLHETHFLNDDHWNHYTLSPFDDAGWMSHGHSFE